MRVGMGGAYGLDFGAVIATGAALGIDTELLAEALPGVEAAMLSGLREDGVDDS